MADHQAVRPDRGAALLLPFAIGHFANDLAPVAMYLLIPAFGAAAGLSPAEIGLLFTIHSAGSSIAFLPAGVLCDHSANRGALLTLTFFWVGFGYLAASLSSDYWTFAILIAVAGMGDAAWHPLATGVLAQLHPQRRAYALGVHAIGGHLSEIAGLLCAGLLLTVFDWRGALQAMLAPAFVMGVAFLLIARRVPRLQSTRPTRADVGEVWRCWTSAAGLRIVALFVSYNMALFAILTMTPVFLRSDHGFSWRETAYALAAMMLLGALSQPLMGQISDRIGRRPVSIIGNGLAALAAFAAWGAPTLAATLLCLGVALTMLVAIRSVLLARAVDHAGGREGVSLGLAFSVMDGLGSLAAVAAGWVGESDLRNAFLLGGALALIAAALSIYEPRRAPRPGLEAPE